MQVRRLEQELRRQTNALSEATALLKLLKQMTVPPWGGRGRFHTHAERSKVLAWIDQSLHGGAQLQSVCRLLGLSTRTIQRWRKPQHAEDRRSQNRRSPVSKLSEFERKHLLSRVHAAQHIGLSPKRLVPMLADEGTYLASESTIYRLLRVEQQEAHNRAQHLPERPSIRKQLVNRPNQFWSWDITYMKGPVRGSFFYLYMIMDVYSRRIMGWRIHPRESASHASRLIRKTCKKNGVDPARLVLHSDNGGPMKGATMLNTLRRLGIVPSFSRPRVSNDNAFAESLFRTLKRWPEYPKQAFQSLAHASLWMVRFVRWYNTEHLHSGIGFIKPDDRHFSLDTQVLARRRLVYEEARRTLPGRWFRQPRAWNPAAPASLIVRNTAAAPPPSLVRQLP